MSNELQIFKSEEFGQVRLVMINNEPMFIGKDLVENLGYKLNDKTTYVKYVKDHCDEDDYILYDKNSRLQQEGVLDYKILGQRGGYLVNESGMYSLVLGSDLPSAKKFKRWITHDVLPTIRKTGGYVNNDDLFINTYLPYADETTKIMFKSTLETVRKQNDIIEKQKQEINNKNKELDYKEDIIVGLTDEIDVAEKRQILNRVVKHKGANYRERWNELYKNFEMKYHVDIKRRMDSYNKDNKPKIKSKIDYIDKVMNKIPELYEIATKLYESDIKTLVQQMYNLRK